MGAILYPLFSILYALRVAFAPPQRRNALAADRVAPHVEPLPPGDRIRRIENRVEAAGRVDIAERRLEEARADCPIGLDHARHPWSIAIIWEELALPQ